MILDFYVDQDTLEFLGKTQIYTGSANYYKCRFRFSQDWDELKKIAVFRVGERFYEQLLEADCCAVPQEALDATGYTRIGIYGTTGGTEEAAEEGGWMRISTNWTKPLRLSEGAYQPDATAPVPPAPDVWEQYIAQVEQVLRKQPTIQNGNWMIYDFEAAGYVDTGVRAEFETADGGFAGGNDATAESGGAVGSGAIAGDGFAGGKNAATKDADGAGIDAIQLGTGTNSVPKSLQVYDYQLMDADGNVPLARIPQLSEKVDKVSGKGLSTNDYTDAEQEKLAGIEAGAEVNTVKSVCGKTGAVALGKEDVGLGNVDNTADLEKPVSAAMQAALSVKADKQNEYGGFAAGDRSESTEGGGAVGYNTYAFAGGAIGNAARTTNAGGAVGANSEAGNGGAVGEGAKTSSGFAGGAGAQAVSADGAGIDAIQLGTGTNSTPKTLQVYSYQLMDADGNIPSARIPQLAEKADKTELIGKAGTGQGAEVFNDYGNNVASGGYAHAEGTGTSAIGDKSHTEGYGTTAASESQHVQGKYNIEDSDGVYAHIVGNGTSDTNRSNAHTLDWSGNAWFAGKVTVGSDAEELATKSDLDAKLGGVYRFKGSIDELPTSSMQIGDVYNMQLDGSATINENFEGLTGTFTVTNTDGYGGTIVFNINDSSFIPTYDFTISLLYNGDLNVDFEVHSENGIYYFHSSMTQIIGIDVGESETFSFSDVTDIKYTIDWGNGDNIAWDGRFWDKLSATVDLSGYYDKTDINGFVDELTETKADKQTEDGGFMAGEGAHSVQDGGAIGLNTATKSGGAVGREAYAVDGGAVGNNTWADLGGAVGNNAVANYGGAIGNGAVAGDGFSGGSEAKVSIGEDGFDIDAIQLGTGTNSVPKTLQVYSHTVMNADGSLPYVHTARPYVEETLPEVLALNTIYDLGTQTSVTLKLPSANVGNFIQVDFLCGDTPATFTIDAASSAIVSDYDFTPEPDKAYSLFFDYGRLAGSLYGWRFSYAEYTYTEV